MSVSVNLFTKRYERKLTPIERFFTRSPYAIVTMVARIKGVITENTLRNAIFKVQGRQPHLRARIIEGADHPPRLTSDGAEAIPVVIVRRESDNHWLKVVQDTCQIPFEFDIRPAILESINYKKLGGLVPPHFSRYEKISEFSTRDDVGIYS